jgi:hypothetical protein
MKKCGDVLVAENENVAESKTNQYCEERSCFAAL